MSELTTAAAAERLGVSQRQVQRLVASGEVPGRRTAGDAWVVDALAVNALSRSRPGRGRPWSPEVAWAALWLLSGIEPEWLDHRARSRLSRRLGSVDPQTLLHACRRRARVTRARVSDSFVDELAGVLVRTGASAGSGTEHGLAAVAGRVDGYCDEQTWPQIERRFHTVPDDRGNAVIRVSALREVTTRGLLEMPRAVIAADLAESREVRERSAGLRALEDLLGE